jgi:hypothetical protein
MRKFLFIRNDDVWTLEKSFTDFFAIMYGLKIPVVYAVIPKLLEKSAAIFLRKAKEKTPDLIDIVQHGYAHENHADAGQRKYEFGDNRTYQQQVYDIEAGIKIMKKWFGGLLTPGFIPPYHSENADTVKALEYLDVPLYSARLKLPCKKTKFLELPAKVWIHRLDSKGAPAPLNFRRVSAELVEALSTQKISGMVCRHHMLTHPNDHKILKALMGIVLREQSQGKVQTVLFSDILNRMPDLLNR